MPGSTAAMKVSTTQMIDSMTDRTKSDRFAQPLA